MIITLDIETVPNADIIPFLPEPEVKLGNLKDPMKIAEKKAEAKPKKEAKATAKKKTEATKKKAAPKKKAATKTTKAKTTKKKEES